jgi:hypothetical protein
MKTVLFILFLFPLYIVFNNLVYNLTGIPFSDYYIYIKGYLCRIDNFSTGLQYHFFSFGLLRYILFIVGFLVSARFAKIAMAFVIYDLLAVLSWIIDNYTSIHLYSLFSSVHSSFYLSNHLFGSPVLLYILQITIFLAFALYSKRRTYLYKHKAVFLYSLASVIVFQLVFTLYNLLD